MLEQVSLLPNKMRHVGVCNTLWKSRCNKISDKVRRRIVRDVQVFAKSFHTSSLSRQPRKHVDKKDRSSIVGFIGVLDLASSSYGIMDER